MKAEKEKVIKKATNSKVRALFEEKKKKKHKKVEKKLKISDIKRGDGAQVDHLLNRIKARESQLVFIFVTVVLFIILVSLYFVFSSVRESVRYNVIKVGDFEVTFNNREKNLGDIVNLTPIIPMSLEEGKKTESYKLRIVNASSTPKSFQIKLMRDVAMIREDNCDKIQLPGQYIHYQIDDYMPQVLDANKRSPILYTDTLAGEEIKFIEVRLWVDEFLPKEYLNYHFHSKLVFKTIETAK